jgi:hypothetical protein
LSTLRTAITASLISLVLGALITLAVQYLDARRANASQGAQPGFNTPSAAREARRAAEARSVEQPARAAQTPTSAGRAAGVARTVPAPMPPAERAAGAVNSAPARERPQGAERAQGTPVSAQIERPPSEAEIAYPDEPFHPAPTAEPSRASSEARGPFNREAAATALSEARARAAACGDGKTAASARVAVSFAPSGRATTAVLEGDSAMLGTPAGSCIARQMRSASVPPFDGSLVTVHTTVRLQNSDQ